jgi:cell shape-determining protein MreC
MSSYNRKIEQSSVVQNIPGTSMQQMWHVLNFHEHRLAQITAVLQNQEDIHEKLEQLKAKVASLEASEE